MDATIRMNDDNYEVIDECGDVWEAIHTSGAVCVCQRETSQEFECGVFFAGAGEGPGTLRMYSNGEQHEIDGTEYEASRTGGWHAAS